MISGVVASEIDGHLQPQPPITTSGVVTSPGTTEGSYSTVEVFFTPSPLGVPATYYVVSGIGTGSAVASGTSSPISITYQFNANTYYSFATQGINSYGAGKFGSAVNYVEPFPATPTPSGLYISIVDTEDVSVNFDYIPSATNYIITASGETNSDVSSQTISGPGTSPVVSYTYNHPFALGVAYDFSVQSENFAGTSAPSVIQTATPDPFGPPLAPVFSATPGGANSYITVTITPDTNPLDNLPNSYSIVDAYGNFGSASGPGTSFILPLNGTLGYNSDIEVTAIGTYGSTTGSQAINFPPGPVTPGPITVNSATNVTVDFTPDTDSQYTQPTEYYLTAIGTDSTYFYANSSSTPATISGNFSRDITYTFYVTATNPGGDAPSVTIGTAEPNLIAAFPATLEAVGGGGGGSWYGGGGAGAHATGSTTIVPGSTTISLSAGTGGTGTGTWNIAGGAGTSSSAGSVSAAGGSGGGVANNSTGSTNKGNGGASGNGHGGGGGNSQAGGGGGGQGGNGSAASGASGGNGGAGVAPLYPSVFGTSICGGGGGRAGGSAGLGYYGNGTYSELNGIGGLATISWTTSSYPGSPTLTGSATMATYGSYTIVYVQLGSSGTVIFT